MPDTICSQYPKPRNAGRKGSSTLNRGRVRLQRKRGSRHTSSWHAPQQNQERRIVMDPTTVFCPNLACPARGQTGQGYIRIHVQKEQRFICTECRNSRFAYFYWGFTNLQCAVFSSIRGFIYLSYSIFR